MTVTVDEPQTLGWRLEARVGSEWCVLDDREDEVFERVGQTRVFRTRGPMRKVAALRFVPDSGCRLRQLDVFAP